MSVCGWCTGIVRWCSVEVLICCAISCVCMNDRMSRLDDVGVCLDREADKRSAKAAAVSSSSVLRRSSYNPTRRASSHHTDDDMSVASTLPPDDDDMSVSSQGSRVPPPRLSSLH